jgi:hydroxymethylbilane synthase
VAAYAEVQGEELFLRGLYDLETPGTYIKGSIRGKKEDAEKLGVSLAMQLREAAQKGEQHGDR